ncbi:peptidoglycan-binding domain-containing protein [Aminobacter sp. HY435]|uniref:peptidoglycan-binding domain-containing protein n=1 Tax=Aminobacter sp. HY435 TaxID=2970917 RepID=UPI0022B9B9F8|nr:peptidoglycan-binding protein [Aminobacter sp. HY435]
MARSARQAKQVIEERSRFQDGAVALGGMIARNPVLVGGSTAFLVALFYVSANALWYQPYAHKSAFFQTREAVEFPDMDVNEPETTIKIERPQAEVVPPQGDPEIEQVQSILRDLNFYTGAVDGLDGPNTRGAIEAYQRKVGLIPTGEVDEALLEQLGAAETTAGIAPRPTPRAQALAAPQARPEAAPTPMPARVATAPAVDMSARIMKIQAGLKAFGNDGIEIDGVIGARTKSAIREFQALFGLPETGEPDAAVHAKMREIGLTN